MPNQMQNRISLTFGSKMYQDRAVRVTGFIYNPTTGNEFNFLRIMKDLPKELENKLSVIGSDTSNARVSVLPEFGGIWNILNLDIHTPLIIKLTVKLSTPKGLTENTMLFTIRQGGAVNNLIALQIPNLKNDVYDYVSQSLLSGGFEYIDLKAAKEIFSFRVLPIFEKVYTNAFPETAMRLDMIEEAVVPMPQVRKTVAINNPVGESVLIKRRRSRARKVNF